MDVPLVPARVFAALADAWRRHSAPAQGWLAPFVPESSFPPDGEPARRFGHPDVVGADLLTELEDWHPARPLRELRALARPLLGCEVDAEAILDDLDGPKDLETLRRQLA